jgi:hypothetical protein
LRNQSTTEEWLYNHFNLSTVRNMPPQYFIIISKTGALDLGKFPYPEWHKKEKENILPNVDIKVEYGEPLHEENTRALSEQLATKSMQK